MDTFIAVDWGTTNRRIYHIENGLVAATARDDLGARALEKDRYPAEIASIRHRYGDLPMVLAGMVGSTIGWRQVPYVELPAGSAELAASLTWMDPRTAIVPGVVQRDPADVMRGEEVQLLGAAEAGMVPTEALLCQPGTHCKWVELDHGRICRFATSMTGELFKLLQEHSILAVELDRPVSDGSAFRDGVRRGAEHRLQTELFGIRARSVLGEQSDYAAFASGLLIGDDVGRYVDGRDVYILAGESLGALYVAAVTELGGQAHQIDSHAAFVAGITRIAEHCA